MPYVYLDATYIKARHAHRIVSRAVVVATAVTVDGNREVLGVDVGDSEDEVFWTTFLRSLRDRGLGRGPPGDLRRPRRAESRDRPGVLRGRAGNAARSTRCATSSPRCPRRPRRWSPPPSARSSPNPTPTATRAQLREVVGILERQFPKAAERPRARRGRRARAYAAFPRAHWRKIASTNPLERINKEIKRRSNVVGIFPDDASVIRLVGAVLVDQHDDWAATERRYLSEGSMALIDTPTPGGDHQPTPTNSTPRNIAAQHRGSHPHFHHPRDATIPGCRWRDFRASGPRLELP